MGKQDRRALANTSFPERRLNLRGYISGKARLLRAVFLLGPDEISNDSHRRWGRFVGVISFGNLRGLLNVFTTLLQRENERLKIETRNAAEGRAEVLNTRLN